MDKVDTIIKQWNQEKPDLDVSSMAIIGRFKRINQHMSVEMGKTFTKHDLSAASFDMLATLRRSGPTHALSPNELMNTMMVTSGTMTNRIDQLCKSELVERLKNPNDGRGFIISLTQKGFTVIDAAIADHVATQDQLTEGLSTEDKHALNSILTRYLKIFEG
jgi:DNA-binding MarR family transcriptional regulator